MNEILLARLILYAGNPVWVERTLDHSLKNGVFEVANDNKLGIVEIASAELLGKLSTLELPTDRFIVREGQDMRPLLRNPDRSRDWRL